ncbi:MAG TPA: hypothetical protein VJ986_15110, partial [Gaiellaceae bacterium]|nr:hypothetical protein [Gaiellaceae bacterium]
MRRMHERRALEVDRRTAQRPRIVDQPPDDRPADTEPLSRGAHEHPLDLADGVAQELEATDADCATVDLCDVEPPSRF